MKGILKWVLWGLVILVLLAFVLYPKFTSKGAKTGSNPATKGAQGLPVKVKAHIVQTSSLDNKVRAVGTIIANEEVELRSEISGRVIRVYFQEGREVRKGQLLVKINDADIQAQLKKALSNLKLSQDNEKRLKTLLEKEGISKADYEASLNQLNVSTAEIELLREQIRKTEIVAPFDGVIGLKYISEGSYINPTSRIAALQNIFTVKIDFSIPERYISLIKVGSKLNFKVENSLEVNEAAIYAIEPKIDAVTRNVQIRAICDNSRRTLFPGAFAEIELILEKVNEAVLIPSESVVPQIRGKAVFVVRQGKVLIQPVELGTRLEKKVQIVKGIQASDTIVTSGILQLKPDSKVQIIGFN